MMTLGLDGVIMNDSWTDYPISVIHWALQSLIGRLIVVGLVICLACGFGVAMAEGSIGGFFTGLYMFPIFALPSLFVSMGLFVLPITLIFTCVFVAHDWPKWTLVLPFVLNVWLAYDYTDYLLNRSFEAKFREEMAESLAEAERKDRERRERKAAEEETNEP